MDLKEVKGSEMKTIIGKNNLKLKEAERTGTNEQGNQ
jgi:hypothetical protein